MMSLVQATAIGLLVLFAWSQDALALKATADEIQVAQFQFFEKKILTAMPSTTRSLFDDQALSTNLSDAYPEAPYVNETYLVKQGNPAPFESLPLDAAGHRILKPGYYFKNVTCY